MAFDPHRLLTTRAQAQAVVTRLARRFGVRAVIIWCPCRRRAGARCGGRILIGPRNGRRLIDSLLHEYAHHLAWLRRPTEHHTTVFYEALVEVTTHWFGHTSQYRWETEYARLVRWARRDGWLGLAADAAPPTPTPHQKGSPG